MHDVEDELVELHVRLAIALEPLFHDAPLPVDAWDAHWTSGLLDCANTLVDKGGRLALFLDELVKFCCVLVPALVHGKHNAAQVAVVHGFWGLVSSA
jgi:hypothetical protein